MSTAWRRAGAAVLLACSVGSAAERIELKLRLRRGQRVAFRQVMSQRITQTVAGREQQTDQVVGVGSTFDVDDVAADGSASLRVSYTWAMMKMDGPMGSFAYDSANPPAFIPPLARGFAALVGGRLTFHVGADGKLQKVEGMDALLAKMVRSLGLPPGPMRDLLEQQMRKQFGEGFVHQMWKGMVHVYPKRSVAIGDTWSGTTEVTAGMALVVHNTWTLQARKDGVATVAVRSTLKSPPGAAAMELGPMRLSYNLSGTQSGTVELDEATGWPIRTALTQRFAGTVTVDGGPTTPAGGLTSPLRAEGHITIDRAEPR